MAEIIEEPTALSKVIPLKFKINDVDVPKTTQLSTNKQFNTTDTDAWFKFELDGLASTSGTYDLTLINLDDKSIFHHADVLFAALPFHYKLNSSEDVTLNEIRHAGRWLGQLVVTLSNGDTTARQFGFNIAGHILDGQDAQVILLSDYQALINTINLAKDDLAQYNIDYAALIADVTTAEGVREQAEIDRAATFDALVESEMIAQNVATKLTEKEATFAPRLLSVESELAETEQKIRDISVNIKDFGAIGDGQYHKLSEKYATLEEAKIDFPTAQSLDDGIDLVAIEKAQNSTVSRYVKIFVPNGVYVFNRTLFQRPGTFYKGNGMFSSEFKLADNANCTLFDSTNEGNHHSSLDGISFNGNSEGQTIEVELVRLANFFIGSVLGTINVRNFYGCGLSLGRMDIAFDHAWVWHGYTTTDRYALEINKDLTGGQAGHYNFNHIYIELFFKGVHHSAAEEKDRAVGMLVNRVVSFYATDLHGEYLKGVMDVKDSFAINIENPSMYGMGNGDGDGDSSFITLLNSNITMLRVGAGQGSGVKYWVKKASGVVAEWLPNELCTSNVHGVYQILNPTNWANQQKNIFNRMKHMGDMSIVNGGLLFERESDANRFFIRPDNDKLKIGTNFNLPDEKTFFEINSTGNNGAGIAFSEPLVTASRDNSTNTQPNAIYNILNVPKYTVRHSTARSIATINEVTDSPAVSNQSADYVGQIYVDTKNKIAYIAVNVGGGVSDWKQMTN